MQKMISKKKTDPKELKARIKFLEKENQWFSSAMEMIASMGDIHRDIPRSTDPSFIFSMARHYLNKLPT